jgi:hypothetical protein
MGLSRAPEEGPLACLIIAVSSNLREHSANDEGVVDVPRSDRVEYDLYGGGLHGFFDSTSIPFTRMRNWSGRGKRNMLLILEPSACCRARRHEYAKTQ